MSFPPPDSGPTIVNYGFAGIQGCAYVTSASGNDHVPGVVCTTQPFAYAPSQLSYKDTWTQNETIVFPEPILLEPNWTQVNPKSVPNSNGCLPDVEMEGNCYFAHAALGKGMPETWVSNISPVCAGNQPVDYRMR